MDEYRPLRTPEDFRLKTQIEIRNLLSEIKRLQENRFFFPLTKLDGSVSFINLSQAAEIERVSDEECHIKFAGGAVVKVTTKEHVDAVIQAIRKAIVIIEDPSKAPQKSTPASETLPKQA